MSSLREKGKQLTGLITSITNVGGYIAEWSVLVMIGLILVEVFMRYVLHRPLRIADEFSAYILAGMSYLGAAYTWKKKGHVRVTSLVGTFSSRVASWLRVVTLVFALAFAFVLSWAGYTYLAFSFRMGMKSSTWLNFPLKWVQLPLVIGFILLLILLVENIFRAISDLWSGRNVENEVP